jgi:hypothetical protein
MSIVHGVQFSVQNVDSIVFQLHYTHSTRGVRRVTNGIFHLGSLDSVSVLVCDTFQMHSGISTDLLCK